MKIGIFDSGLGGLMIAHAIREALPKYDYFYLGDTLNLPYGRRSRDAIYDHTRCAVDFLFRQDCHIIIVACNTASVAAVSRLQKEYLVEHYPKRRILSVVVPVLEDVSRLSITRVGLIGTQYTVQSGVYEEELSKTAPNVQIFSQATPLLVPLLEGGGEAWLEDILSDYLYPLLMKKIEALILGCTHYTLLKPYLNRILPQKIKVLSQDEIIPNRLKAYLNQHPEHTRKMTNGGGISYALSDITPAYKELYPKISFKKVDLY